jgi:hypothetical protein
LVTDGPVLLVAVSRTSHGWSQLCVPVTVPDTDRLAPWHPSPAVSFMVSAPIKVTVDVPPALIVVPATVPAARLKSLAAQLPAAPEMAVTELIDPPVRVTG